MATELAKIPKPKPTPMQVEQLEDQFQLTISPSTDGLVKSATGRQSTQHFVYNPTQPIVDANGNQMKQVKVTYIVSDADYLKQQQEREKHKIFRLFASAFKKINDADIIERFAADELRLKPTYANEKKTAVILTPSENEGYLLSELPTATSLPDDKRVDANGKVIEWAFDKIRHYLDERQKKVKLDVNKLLENVKTMKEMIEKLPSNTPDSVRESLQRVLESQQQTYDSYIAAQARAAKKKNTSVASVSPVEAHEDEMEANAQALGITKEARDIF